MAKIVKSIFTTSIPENRKIKYIFPLKVLLPDENDNFCIVILEKPKGKEETYIIDINSLLCIKVKQ